MGKGLDHKRPVFARHRERRARGVPTLSLLVGDVDVAQWCWMRWQRVEGSSFVCSHATSRDAVLRDWLSGDALREALVAELAKRGGTGGPMLSAAPRSLAEIEAAVGAVLPGLLALPPRSTSGGDLSSLLSTLLRIADTLPRIDLACALSEAQFVRWRQEADAAELRLVAEGLIGVEPVAREPDPEASAARRSRSSQRRTAQSRDAAVPRLEYDADAFMRSRAERALYEHLQARPRTRGLFALQRSIAGPSGARPVEVALLSESLKVALELRAHEHPSDESVNRRDGDKEILLQRLGYTVVLVLASDVDMALERVTETIERVVEHAQRKRTE